MGSTAASVVAEIPEQEDDEEVVLCGESVGNCGVIGDTVKNVDTPEISEGAMQYLKALLDIHKRKLSQHFAATERKLLDKISSLEEKISEKDEVIAELRSTNDKMETRVSKMEQQIAVVRAANSSLTIQQDDLQQYGRRTNIRIEGLEYSDNETQDNLKNKIEEALF